MGLYLPDEHHPELAMVEAVMSNPTRGLQTITPRLGARLVQEG